MLNSVVQSFSAKAQMVNSLPGCWDRNLDTLTRPLTSIQPSPFLLCLAIFSRCTNNSIWSICASRSARFWASASAEAVNPQLIEKNQKMRQAVAASARAVPLTVFGLAAHRRLTFFNHVRRVYRVEFCIRLVDHVELGGGILPCKRSMWPTRRQDAETRNLKRSRHDHSKPPTHHLSYCALPPLPWCTLPLRNHPLPRHRPLLRTQVCR